MAASGGARGGTVAPSRVRARADDHFRHGSIAMTSQEQDGTGAGTTLVDLLRRRAEEEPEAEAFASLTEGQGGPPGLTFGELDREARAIAAALQRAGVEPGERALLFYPPGAALLPALFGCLYAGVVAVAAHAPRGGERPPAWLLELLADCRPAIALTSVGALVPCRAAVAGAGPLEEVPWLVTDAISPASARAFCEVPLGPDTAAVLHFPSGPAAFAAGVTVTHGRLLGPASGAGLSGPHRAPWLPLLRELARAA